MQVVYERCCGLDVHKLTVVACVIVPGAAGQPHKETRTFETLTENLQALAEWLETHQVSHVAMESTGVYWKPIYNLLDGRFHILVVNAEHIKALQGHKTDVQDAEWLADLLQHGLLKGSFIPSAQLRELRDLTRYRTKLGDDRHSEINRLHKVLEDANIKLSSVATDLMGASARAMLAELVKGNTDAALLADLAKGRLREKQDKLQKALQGTVKPHHQFMLAQHLSHIEFLDEAIEKLDAQIAELMRPFEVELAAWDSLPGINRRIGEIVIAELGPDLKPFATAPQLAAWAGMCPGNDQSGGKRKNAKTRKGSKWLRRALIEAAHGAAHKKQSYFRALYHRLVPRRGKQKAAVAVGHSLLVTGYYLITRGKTYHDLGENYFDERNHEYVKRRAVKRLEKLGFQVQLTAATAIAL
jgi:transposase